MSESMRKNFTGEFDVKVSLKAIHITTTEIALISESTTCCFRVSCANMIETPTPDKVE